MDEKNIIMQQEARVSVSKSRTVNLGKYGLQYEKEEVFVSVQADLGEGKAKPALENLLAKCNEALEAEVKAIEQKYAKK